MNRKAISQIILSAVFLPAFFLLPFKAYAVRSITISSGTTSLSGYQEMTIHVASISGFIDGETIYIKGAFYKDGTSNYFGFTNNNGTWIKNGDSITSQKQIQAGSWDENLTIKSDFDDTGYTGSGGYKVKVGFYVTSGGSLSSVNWSANSLDVTISSPPTPTPTNTPTPTPTNLPTNTPTPVPTATPAPTAIPSKISPSPSPMVSPVVDNRLFDNQPTQAVLGMSLDDKEPTPPPAGKNGIPLVILFGAGGICILLSCGILFFYKWKTGTLPQLFHETVNEEA